TNLHRKVTERCRAAENAEGLRDYTCTGLVNDDERWIILHMHDPFMSDVDVTTFLSRYVEVCEEPRRIMDRRNVWAGNRQYRVKLQADGRSPDGFKHPPATFAIGSSRGYLYYRDQPPFCRKCRGFGHRDADCEVTECSKCHSRDHSTRNCNIKECSLCGAEGHLYRQCNRRNMDYSRALRGEIRLFGEDS
uniref:CCHC-type domain-containing protein n=1 Tax=Lepisosteus oculatus TaxID=7918 RepID=W5NLG6_LEPOC